MNQAPSMLKPALISGVAFGVAGSIPVVNWINCACCALIIGCGVLAAFLYSKECQRAGFAFSAGNGATVGLVSGLVYGVVSGILGGLINAAFGMGDWQEVIEQVQASGAEIDPEVLNQVSSFMESSGSLLMILIGIFFALLFGAIFGTLGGLIGGSVFKIPAAAAQYEQAPPPPPPVG
jgi:hypothetical protein